MKAAGFGRLFGDLKDIRPFPALLTGTKEKCFSAFALFSIGLATTMPLLPPGDAGELGASEADRILAAEAAVPSDNTAELLTDRAEASCRIQQTETKEEKLLAKEPSSDTPALRQEKEDPCSAAKRALLVHSDAEATPADNTQKLSQKISGIVGDAPIAAMVPAISHYDADIAGLLVGIAKKESSWGEHVPTKNGEDCYNYWGYKGAGSRGTSMGYGCFASPEEGVEAIGTRLEEMVDKREGKSEPSRLVVAWKCGSSCATHSPSSVQKWVSDVHQYYSQITYQE
ncbi:MAG: hypothetical protein WDN67_03650 [Candidatus Moraniibacteriota bacterium]